MPLYYLRDFCNMRVVCCFLGILLLFSGQLAFAQGTDFFGVPEPPAPVPSKPKLQPKPKPKPPAPKAKPKPKPKAKVVLPPPKNLSVSDILFLLDTSGSMDAHLKGEDISKLDAAKKALTFVAQNMEEGIRFQLWSFNAKITPQRNSPELKPRPKKVVFEPIGAKNSKVRKHLTRQIKRLDTRGGTNLYEAVFKALRYFKSSTYTLPNTRIQRRKIIVILADGQDDDLSVIKLRHVQKIKASSPSVQINTIGFGIMQGSPFHQILCDIASTPQSCSVTEKVTRLQTLVQSFTH